MRLAFGLSSLAVLGLLACGSSRPAFADPLPAQGQASTVPAFWVRPGFKLEIAAENFGEARFLEFGPKGDLYVTQPGKGTISTLREKGGKYTKVADFTTGHKSAHGMHYKDGWLWFTESGAVFKARDKDGDGKADETVTVLEGLPNGGHWWRSIFVVEDGFFTSIGDPGNITDQTDTDREKIWKYSLDGKTRKLWSSGLRNTEKLRYRPGTTDLYGADHGSDWFGQKFGDKQGNQPITDDIPPCEFNLYKEGAFYGHPFLVGNRIPRPEFQDKADIIELAAKTTVPAWCFGAHWAPNGFAFVDKGGILPQGDAVVALHGSWNSSKPVGYRIEQVMFDDQTGTPMGARMIVGTVADGKVLGRPVDVVQAGDGSLLWSDDQTNRIYRIRKTR